MSSHAISLPPFALLAPIGRGGMSEVWRAVHVAQDVPVAIKVLRADGVKRAHREALANEVRQVARLTHKNVIMVFDHGRIDDRAAERSNRRLAAGSPYLAMELVTGGTLHSLTEPLRWSRLRALLRDVLAALAHAHARGVIHRDLKPANVLLAGDGDARGGIKLTDFGIAHALASRRRAGQRRREGTPRYMAPEQIAGDPRDEGPWTDLYALGLIAYALTTGTRPYPDARGEYLVQCQLERPLPPLVPRRPIPADFEGWIRRLTAKDPTRRFARAADAEWALRRLSGEMIVPGRDTPAPDEVSEIRTLPAVDDHDKRPAVDNADDADDRRGDGGDGGDTRHDEHPRGPDATNSECSDALTATTAVIELPDSAASETPADDDVPPDDPEPPPIPPSWRRRASPTPMQLIGVGLGLYGLRPAPFVGRQRERDAIWAALGDVAATGRPRVLAILGAPGCGKTRLIEWMAERAHELGAASVLRATHGPIASPGDGLRPMLARAIGCDGLPWPAALARCSRFLDRGNRRDESVLSVDSTETNAASINDLKDRNNHTPAPNDTAAADRDERDALEAEALAALVADPQHTGDADPPIRFTRPRQRYRVARRLLARLSATRTLILWIDNAQWATDALAFVSDLLDADDLRVLVLASVREDALAAQPTAATLLADILARPRCRRLDIGALPPAEHAQLVEKLLGLAGDLAATVAARTAGNPLFAEQLIRDWVQRGVLIASANGFALEPGTSADIPDDIHALWAGKVARIAADSEDAVAALELAAALGHEVREDEWRQCCEVAGLALPSDMVERMLGARLVDPRPNGWSFTHAMLRESLDRAAREGGRFKNHHKTCAAALARLYPDGAADDRRGRHLLAAGVLEESLEPLLAGAEARRRAGDFVRAHVLYGDRTQALAALELPQTDARWGQTWVRQARAYATQGRADDAAQLAERAATAANRHGWPEVAAWAAMVRGYIELGRGEPRRAAAAFTDARDRFAALSADDSTGLADCLAGMGRVHMWLSELDEATRCYDAAYALHQASGDLYDLGITLRGLSGVAHCRGELAQARELLERARSCFEQSGSRPDVASCLNDLGELARSADDADEAAALYRRSAAMFEALGCDDASTPRYNLGLVQLASGDPDGAAAVFAAELGRLENGQRTIDALWLHAGLLPCAAASGDWARFDRELRAVQARLKGFVDEDLAWCTGHAGQAAAAAGQTARAQRALAIARDQWTRLDRPVELSAIEAAVAALDALDAPEP